MILRVSPFAPQKVLDQLSQSVNRLSTPPPCLPLTDTFVPQTPFTKEALVTLMDQYNPLLSTHSLVMQKMKKAIAMLFADRSILQHTNVKLFKANMAKAKRIQKKKEKRANATYGSAFGRVLTPAQAAAARKEALEREELAKAKKLALDNRKTASAEKKKAMEEAKQQRLQVCLAELFTLSEQS